MLSDEMLLVVQRIIQLELDFEDNSLEIEKLSLDAIKRLKESGEDLHPELYKFLDDFDIRRRDADYREYQTDKVRDVLRTYEQGNATAKG